MKLIMPSTVSKVYLNILNYNGWADTIECLESVLRNDYPNYQVIFDTLIITRPPNKRAQKVDETYEIAQKYGKNVIKDRLPREAALLGCCVITGKRGTAAFYEDVPIPNEYKFDDKEENIPKIIEKIKDCFENFEDRYKNFDYYRQVIKNEPQKFLEDLKKIFVKVEKDNQL